MEISCDTASAVKNRGRTAMHNFGALSLGAPRPGTEVSGALRARNPKRVRKCPVPRRAPQSPKSAPCSPKRVHKRCFGLFLDSFQTPGHTLWALWGSPEPPRNPFGLFSDSFEVPGPKGLGDRAGGSQLQNRQRGSARRASALRARILFVFRVGNLCSILD